MMMMTMMMMVTMMMMMMMMKILMMLMMVVPLHLQVLSKEVGRACSVREPIDSKVIVSYLLKSL